MRGLKLSPRIRNVILISIDALRYDAVGYEPDQSYLRDLGDAVGLIGTPSLDRLAAESVVFHGCYTSAPYTTSAHASLLTGCWPPRHGVRAFGGESLSGGVGLIADALRGMGFSTLHASSFPELFDGGALGGQRRGVDQFIGINSYHYGRDEKNVLDWIRSRRGSPRRFFVFYHTYFVHDYIHEEGLEYDPQISFVRQALKMPLDQHARIYIRSVGVYDRLVLGPFLEALRADGVLEDTLVVLTSDHGEGLRPECRVHCWGRERFSLCEQNLRVPLLFRLPGRSWHRDIASTVRGVDVFPTILDLVSPDGRSGSPGVDGSSLVPMFLGSPAPSRQAYAESWGPLSADSRDWVILNRCLIQGSLKLVRAYAQNGPGYDATDSVYDLSQDPWERAAGRNIRPDSSARLRREIGAWEASDFGAGKAWGRALGRQGREERPTPPDSLVVLRLRQMGYLD